MVEVMMQMAQDPRSQKTLEIAKKAANTNATILLTGETGVGKEVLAKYIHRHSPFREGEFVSVNCAALPANMVEAILFGYEKGAFTSAINHYVGKFEQAHQGTLLLDEISEIPLELQAKLLRVIQERQVEKIGGKKLIDVNVRIITATNRDLHHLVTEGLFRSDLYYRLNVVPIVCAPLRERILDIVPLAEFFIQKHAALMNRDTTTLTEAAKRKLEHYNWPGNIREMENIIQRALIMTADNKIDDVDLEFNEESSEINLALLKSELKINEAKLILEMLQETNGNRSTTAKNLQMSPRTLRHKISKLKLLGLKVP